MNARSILSGFGWVGLTVYSERALGFATTLILAKYVAPQDFGIIALASIMIEVLMMFKDLGINQALIFQKEDIRKTSITAFWVITGYNTALFCLAALASPLVAGYYGNSTIMPVAILLSSTMVWDSLRAIPVTLLTKEMQFRKLLIPEAAPMLAASILSIIMAVNGMGVWSLVARTLVISIGRLMLIWRYTDFRPVFEFSMPHAKQLFSYGKYIIGSSLLLVLMYNIDKFYVSTFAGLTALGFYELATRIAKIPISELSHLVGYVTFPAFSKMNREPDMIRRAFISTIRYTAMLSIPLSMGLAFFGPLLISVIYGPKWEPMGVPLQVLCIYGLFRSVSSIIHDAFKAMGRPDAMQKYILARFIAIASLGVPAIRYGGVEGVCVLIAATHFTVMLFELKAVAAIMSTSVARIVRPVCVPLALSLSCIPAAYFSVKYYISNPGLAWVAAGIMASAVFYLAAIGIFDMLFVGDLKRLAAARQKA